MSSKTLSRASVVNKTQLLYMSVNNFTRARTIGLPQLLSKFQVDVPWDSDSNLHRKSTNTLASVRVSAGKKIHSYSMRI